MDAYADKIIEQTATSLQTNYILSQGFSITWLLSTNPPQKKNAVVIFEHSHDSGLYQVNPQYNV